MLKLGSNESPLGPSAQAIVRIREMADKAHLYPDDSATGLKAAIAEQNGLSPNQIILGTGSDEVIAMVLHTYCGHHNGIATAMATFPMYGISARGFGGSVEYRPMREHTFDLEAYADVPAGHVVCLADPNNPTGTTVDFEQLLALVSRRRDVLFLYDAAYEEYRSRPAHWRWDRIVDAHPNLFVTRTFSKAYGLAGLRVGYGYGHADLVGHIQRVRPPFNVNALALAAAEAAIRDQAHLRLVLETHRESLEVLLQFCRQNNLPYIPSSANFLLVRMPPRAGNPGETTGQAWARMLLDTNIIVRALPGIGYDDWLRISTGTVEQMQQVCHTLQSMLAKPG